MSDQTHHHETFHGIDNADVLFDIFRGHMAASPYAISPAFDSLAATHSSHFRGYISFDEEIPASSPKFDLIFHSLSGNARRQYFDNQRTPVRYH